MIAKKSFVAYLVLNLVTCGIYSIIFWYMFGEDMNKLCDGDGQNTENYILVIVLSIITCGIYMWIWQYNIANRTQANGARYGLTIVENGTSFLLWKILGMLLCCIGSYYADYILFKNINLLIDSYNGDTNTYTNN